MNAAGEAPMTGTPSPGFFLFSYVCAATVKISELDGFFLLRFAATFTCPYNGKAERASVLCFFFRAFLGCMGRDKATMGWLTYWKRDLCFPFFSPFLLRESFVGFYWIAIPTLAGVHSTRYGLLTLNTNCPSIVDGKRRV